MVSLPELSSYGAAEWRQLSKVSPISEHYQKIIQRSPKDFSEAIRQKRHRAWLECAFATFVNRTSAQDVCSYWSGKADHILSEAWTHHGLVDSPFHLLAFGKLGSQELNLSSDIDIVFVSDKKGQNLALPSLKSFIKSLNEVTEWGFCFRVDMDLRPGGPASPLLSTIDSFIHFYGYHGEPWHRMSFIRCRALTKGAPLPKDFLSFLSNYSYPRRLDYRILNSIRGLRQKIHQQDHNNIHLKLSPGGIRDIEFMVQSMQLLYGGRIESLRSPSIQTAMENLTLQNFLTKNEGNFLSQFYWELREIENSVQCKGDQHTYTFLKTDVKALDLKFSYKEIEEKLHQTDALISNYFEEDQKHSSFKSAVQNASFTLSPSTQSRIEKYTDELLKTQKVKSKALQSQQAILHQFHDITKTHDIAPDLAMNTFLDFLTSANANASLFYIFSQNPKILEQLAWLFAFSPYTGKVLTRRPELVDSFAIGSVEIQPDTPYEEKFVDDLLDYKLLNQLIAISYFLKNKNLADYSSNLSLCADTIAKNIILFLKKKFPTDNIDILCLGKWGGRELGVFSDLDFIFVTKKSPQKADFQVAKRFVNLISYPSKSGKLYNIDMRLKPQEGFGPMIVSLSHLKDFMINKAEDWQKQAYLKSRFLLKEASLYQNMDSQPSLSPSFSLELTKILKKVLKNGDPLAIDLKYNPGGIVHTEFIVQKMIMKNRAWLSGPSLTEMFEALSPKIKIGKELRENYYFLRQTEQLVAICTDATGTRISENSPFLPKLEQIMKRVSYFHEIQSTMGKQLEMLKALDPHSLNP